jgi:type IV pilus assembly protein PilQ
MIIKRSFIFLIAFIACGFPIFSSQSTGQPVAGSEITSIDIHDSDGTTEIEIKSSAPFTYTIYKQSDPYHVIVDLQDTGFGTFQEKLSVDKAGVLDVTPVEDPNRPNIARLEIALTVPADIEPVYSDRSLILAFDNPDAGVMAELEPDMEETQEEEPVDEDAAAPSETTDEDESVWEQKYVGEKINIDFQGAELTHVFRLISDISGYNIVVSPDVKGKFSMRLADVPWDQALDVILRNYSLSKTVEGNIVRIAPTSVLAKEEEEIARAKESQEKAGDLVTRVYPINYAAVGDVKKAIDDAKILTKRGFISTDERTSSVIIKDVGRKHVEYESLIDALDIPTPQVNIDAKIVEVRQQSTKELGIQWGMFWEPPDSRMRITGDPLLSGGSSPRIAATDDSGTTTSMPWMVNLPAIVGAGKGGHFGLGYINAAGLFAIDMQLSALESTGKAKVISNPKITTSDNEEAKIMQGEKIPYQTISDSGTQTQFMEAFLELIVTPHITPEGTVVMKLAAKKNEADFTRQVLGVPTISIKEVKTQVLINSNDTLVIGGIFTSDTTKNVEAIPGFSEIPILGRLFQKKIDLEEKNELLIFITPRIVSPMQ